MRKSIIFSLLLSAASPLLAQAAARPAAQPIPRAAFIVTMDGEFRKVDANGDGQLVRAEVNTFQKAAALATAQAQRGALFAALDTDRNGQISPAEFGKVPVTPPATNPDALMRFDVSKDGKVSLIEHRTATLAKFDRLDVDKDGVVSAAEMKAGGIAPR